MKSTWAYVIAALFFLMGAAYVAAAVFGEPEQLTDSVGGPWVQGLGAWAIAIALLLWGRRLQRKEWGE